MTPPAHMVAGIHRTGMHTPCAQTVIKSVVRETPQLLRLRHKALGDDVHQAQLRNRGARKSLVQRPGQPPAQATQCGLRGF